MKEIWASRAGQVAAKYGEIAPVACCNACRTCVTNNVFAVVVAALAGVADRLPRAFRR